MIPLVMSVIAKTETFQRDMAKAGKSVNRFGTSMRSSTATAMRFGRRLLIMAGIGGLGYVIKQQMAAIDSTAKLSDRLGIATEALIGLQHGASIAGVELTMINKSLEIFSRRLGEVALGTGEAERALEALGLSYEEIIGKSPDEAIGIVADQINKLGTQAEKAAAANFLFGRAGAQLLNMFESGSVGIEKYRKEAEKLGLTFSRIDAAKVEAANDSLTRTRAVFTGLFRQGTIELAPYIEALSTAFVEFATQGEGVGANVVDAFEGIALSVVTVAEEVEGLLMKLNQLTSPIDAARAATEANQRAILRYRTQTGETGAFKYTQGLLRPPIQPKDRALFERIQAEEKAKAGAGVASRKGTVTDTFADIRKRAQANAEARAIEVEAARMTGAEDVEIATQTNEEKNKLILASTREKLASIRSMHDKTRMEKIQILEDYRVAHFGHTEEIEAAEQLLKDEILSIQQSRVDAMKVYNAELQEDMEYSALYAKEKFVDAAQEIEGSMSSAFQSMIQGGANFRDAMRQFFMDIGTSFGKMASDMMARAIMMKTMGIIMGGGGLGGDAVGAGGQAFTPSNPYGLATNPVQRHSGWVPYGTPSFQRGRGLKSNEMAAIIEKDEMLVPNKQIAKGVSGSANYEPKFNIIIVRDEKAAYLEAMNSKEGEKSYIRHASRNRNI